MKWLGLERWVSKLALWRSLVAVWFLVRDGRTPRTPKLLAWLVLAYALSPIDLIPDFIPVLGLLDDLLLVPLGVWLIVRLSPPPLWQQMLDKAQSFEGRLPRMRWGLVLVLLIWLVLLLWFVWWLGGALWQAL